MTRDEVLKLEKFYLLLSPVQTMIGRDKVFLDKYTIEFNDGDFNIIRNILNVCNIKYLPVGYYYIDLDERNVYVNNYTDSMIREVKGIDNFELFISNFDGELEFLNNSYEFNFVYQGKEYRSIDDALDNIENGNSVLYDLLKIKFENEELRDRLLDISHRILWSDALDNNHFNVFGNMLMSIRSKIRFELALDER